MTPLVRVGRPVAYLWHRPGLLADPVLVEEVAAAARLAFEHERLRAETAVQLEDLRSARARVIATGDAERRRLERDLHDGAQQRVVGIAFALRLARADLADDPDPAVLVRLDEADAEVRAALAELRQLAHGIFPAVVADEGLAAALEELAEGAPVAIALRARPDRRLAPDVEAAGYFVVAETLRRSGVTQLAVDARRRDGWLVIEVESDGDPLLVDLEDRVGALGGTVEAVPGESGSTIRAEIPCGS
jgi:signal transduction histidine kinase